MVIGHFYIRPEMLAGFKPLSTTDENFIDTSGYADVSMRYLSMEGSLLVEYRFWPQRNASMMQMKPPPGLRSLTPATQGINCGVRA